jgi:hypothetical protein
MKELAKILGVVVAGVIAGALAYFYPAPFVVISITTGLALMAAGVYEMMTKE